MTRKPGKLNLEPLFDSLSLGFALNRQRRIGFAERNCEPAIGEEVLYHGPHLLTGAPTGAGKGRSFAIPTLLTYPGQIVALDIKGELYHTTSRRRREMGQAIVTLNPFRVCGEFTDALNPCDAWTLQNADIDTDCQGLASLLSNGLKFSKDAFWDGSAGGVITGLLSYMAKCEPPEKRTIPRLRDLLHQDDVAYNIAVLLDTKGKEMGRVAYQELAAFLQHPERETRPSVQSTAVAYLKAFMSDRVADSLGPSTFSLADFANGKPMTIYIVIPADRLESHRSLLRMWFGTLLKAIFCRNSAPNPRTLLLIDEAAQLGPFPMLQTAVTLSRSYGVRCWMMFQDLQQLTECYPQSWRTIINNCGAINCFGVTSRLMAEEWAEVIDCRASDLLQLGPGEQLLQIQGRGAFPAKKHDYLLDRRFQGLYDCNQFHNPSIG